MGEQEELQLDFGTPELNDPQYEQNVGGDDTVQGGAADGTTETAPDAGAQQVQTQEPNAGQNAQDGQQAGTGTQPNGGAQQQGQGQQSADPRHRVDAKGNLVDADGKIIARAGAERRQLERTQAQGNYIARLEAENKQLKDNDSMSRALNEVPSKLGLDMRETELGLQAIASFKKDPVATAKWMLQETMRQGYTLEQIIGADAQGKINGGSLDLAAIKSMIADQVQPLIADRQAQQSEMQSQQAAQREYEGFLAKHDHANVHEDVLANMLQGNPSLTPEIAYWQLREYAAKHQLDFTQPLRAQVAAREQGGQQQPNGNATPQAQPNAMPMPNGSAPTQDMQRGPTMAAPDDNWDSIVQQSLQEAGFTH